MLRFQCPTCQTVNEAPDDHAGGKVLCNSCGQKLQIPVPPKTKTVLAPLVEVVPEEGAMLEVVSGPPPLPAWATRPPVLPEDDEVSVRRRHREPEVACFRCGELVPHSESVRTTSVVGGWFGSVQPGYLWSYVDLCPDCYRRQQYLGYAVFGLGVAGVLVLAGGWAVHFLVG